MMKYYKYILGFVLLFFCVNVINAQKLKVKWGNYGETDLRAYVPKIFGEDSDFLYAYDVHKKYIVLEQIDKKKMKSLYYRKLEIPSRKRRKFEIEEIRLQDGVIQVFASYYTRWKRTVSLECIEFDAGSSKYLGKKEIIKKDVDKRLRQGHINVRVSDNNEFVFVHFSAYYKKLDHVKEEFHLYDSKLESLIIKKRVLENYNKPPVFNYLLDNEGTVYFTRGSEIVILDRNIDYEYWSQIIYHKDMPLGGFLGDLSLTLTPSNEIVIFGSYFGTDYYEDEKGKNSKLVKNGDTQAEGAFFMKMNGFSKEIVVSEISRFDQSFIDQFKTEKDIKKNRELELNSIAGQSRFYPKSDGGMVVITETYDLSGFALGGYLAGAWFYHKDLLVYNFDPKGKMLWSKRVPKKQVQMEIASLFPPFVLFTRNGVKTWWTVESSRLKLSYVAGLSDDRIYIVFNDHSKNKSRVHDFEDLKSMGNIRKSVPTVVSIDLKTGAKTKRSDYGFASGDAKIQYTMARQKQQGDTLFLFAAKRKKYKYGFVDLNNDRMKAPTLEEEKKLMDDYLAKEERKKDKKRKDTNGRKP